MKVYGIPNCDTVKKTLDWFKANKIDYEFHDFKKQGITPEKLQEWNDKAGYEVFLNKKSTTWKDLDAGAKEDVKTFTDALPLLQERTSMIKRPVIEDGSFLYFGFDAEVYTKHFLR